MSEQDDDPGSFCSFPAGHSWHDTLGSVLWSWKKPARHSEHDVPATELNFPLSLMFCVKWERKEEERGGGEGDEERRRRKKKINNDKQKNRE